MSTDDRTDDPSNRQLPTDRAPGQQYEICVAGHVGTRWTTWFDGLTLTSEEDGTTAIRGPVVDQAALHGLLQKLRDLGITLLSLTSSASPTAIKQPNDPHNRTSHQSPGAPL